MVMQPCNTQFYNENGSKNKNHTASSVAELSSYTFPIKGPKPKPEPAMFQPWPFRHNINKNKTQNHIKKTKTVQRRVQGNFILFLSCIRKSIKTWTIERTYKLQCERNKTEREYKDANKLA